MLHSIGTGSFTVTWLVPVTVIDVLRKKRAVKVYKEFNVSRLEIYVQTTAVCVYQTPVQQLGNIVFTCADNKLLGRFHLFLHLPVVVHQLYLLLSNGIYLS